MNIKDFFKHAFAAAKEEGITLEGVSADTTADDAVASLNPPDPRVAEMQKQIDAHKAELAAMRAAAIQKDAEAFASEQIVAHRAYPAERTAIVALYTQAATNGGLDQVRSAYASRPAHQLTGEQIRDAQLFALGQDTNAKDQDQEAEKRRKALMNMTPIGKAALNGGK